MVTDVLLQDKESGYGKSNGGRIKLFCRLHLSEFEVYPCLLIMHKVLPDKWSISDICLLNQDSNQYESVSMLYSEELQNRILHEAISQVFETVVA